jgi:hypothetical protein
VHQVGEHEADLQLRKVCLAAAAVDELELVPKDLVRLVQARPRQLHVARDRNPKSRGRLRLSGLEQDSAPLE